MQELLTITNQKKSKQHANTTNTILAERRNTKTMYKKSESTKLAELAKFAKVAKHATLAKQKKRSKCVNET